jgi:hypothetical protein
MRVKVRFWADTLSKKVFQGRSQQKEEIVFSAFTFLRHLAWEYWTYHSLEYMERYRGIDYHYHLTPIPYTFYTLREFGWSILEVK